MIRFNIVPNSSCLQARDIQAFSGESRKDARVGYLRDPLKRVSKLDMHNPGIHVRRRQSWQEKKNQTVESFKLLLRNYFSLYESC